ncbi:MAG: hypothetical protein GY950_19180, partial [bacterium]|nr:hypothetical protein [bacterium]
MLTTPGIDKKYPVAGGKDTIFYVNRNYKEYPGIYKLDVKTGKSRRLTKKRGINGLFYHPGQGELYFSAADYYKSFYYYSDIYRLDLENGRVKRLTRGRRLFHPVKAGNVLYCIKREGANSYLARLDEKHGKETILSPGFSAMAYPAISPAGDVIAVSLKGNNGNWRIGFFTPGGELVKQLTPASKKSYYPVWKNARLLYYIREYKDAYRLAGVDVKTGITTIYNDRQVPPLRYFSLVPGKDEAVLSFFDAAGFNLGRVDLAKLESREIAADTADVADTADTADATPALLKDRGYGFLRDLSPKYFTLDYRSGGNEYQPGIYLSGTDILSEHSFGVGGYYGLETGTFNWNFNYTFDGFYPSLTFTYSDLTDLHQTDRGREYTVREREMEFTGMVPLVIKSGYQAWGYTGVYFETVNLETMDGGVKELLDLNGIKVGILFNSSKWYYDSISPADGFRLALSYSRDVKFLGSDHEANTAALEFKHYLSVFRPNVLAFRLVVSDSWGDIKRIFYMGGSDSYTGYG